ncbi:MAG: branched-chain amino acid ABC transporter permease [Pseudomonadota bacterium]
MVAHHHDPIAVPSRRVVTLSRAVLANLLVLGGVAGAALFFMLADQPYVVTLATKVAILGLAGVGLNLALGTGGLVSLGHAAFFGIGGYAAGILSWHAQNYTPFLSWPLAIDGSTMMPVLWAAAVAIGGLAALIIGWLSLRSSGVYFIMITLAFAQMIYYFAISWPTYGGEDGLPLYVRNEFPGLNTLDPVQFFLLTFVLLCAAVWLVARITASRFGLALETARQNEARLVSVGITPFNVRLVAFTISGAITALAGALYADLNRFVSPEMLSWHTSGEIIVFVILGGIGRLCGPIAGAATYIILEQSIGPVTEYWEALLGCLLLVIVLYAPGGVMRVLAGERRHG